MRLRLRYSSLWENSDVYRQVRTITCEKRPFEIRNYSISARGIRRDVFGIVSRSLSKRLISPILVHYHILRATRLRLRYSSLWENSDVYRQVRTITCEKRPFEIRNHSISARGVGNAKYISRKAFRSHAS
ncbi:hypothetical protein CDAR_296861 [Caerostris darwini]|uniref:Uncharacterized protein n=1 Tax=Caerostris darwini TaxID=1538125 RepID=A0AAV4N7W0_9ARAC|nr:hypothetical protein CDAR_296861 [Caerostris darwini]